MTHGISYQIAFLVPATSRGQEELLAAIKLVLHTLEKLDYLMVDVLKFPLTQRWALREMGEKRFLYDMIQTLIFPPQLPLGNASDDQQLLVWMERVRKDFLSKISPHFFIEEKASPEKVNDLTETWDRWADEEGLSHNVLYLALSSSQITPLMRDLSHAFVRLGGYETVELL